MKTARTSQKSRSYTFLFLELKHNYTRDHFSSLIISLLILTF